MRLCALSKLRMSKELLSTCAAVPQMKGCRGQTNWFPLRFRPFSSRVRARPVFFCFLPSPLHLGLVYLLIVSEIGGQKGWRHARFPSPQKTKQMLCIDLIYRMLRVKAKVKAREVVSSPVSSWWSFGFLDEIFFRCIGWRLSEDLPSPLIRQEWGRYGGRWRVKAKNEISLSARMRA